MPTSSNHTDVSVHCCHGKQAVGSSRTLLSDHICCRLRIWERQDGTFSPLVAEILSEHATRQEHLVVNPKFVSHIMLRKYQLDRARWPGVWSSMCVESWEACHQLSLSQQPKESDDKEDSRNFHLFSKDVIMCPLKVSLTALWSWFYWYRRAFSDCSWGLDW
jgi:hypothetical protein